MSFFFVNLSNFVDLVAKKMQEKKKEILNILIFWAKTCLGKNMKNEQSCSSEKLMKFFIYFI